MATESTDKLTAIYQSPASTEEEKQWAKEMLEYAASRIDAAKGLPPLNQAAVRMLGEYDLSGVLKGTDRLVITTVNGGKRKALEPVEAV